jgi:hypothetical protein
MSNGKEERCIEARIYSKLAKTIEGILDKEEWDTEEIRLALAFVKDQKITVSTGRKRELHPYIKDGVPTDISLPFVANG